MGTAAWISNTGGAESDIEDVRSPGFRYPLTMNGYATGGERIRPEVTDPSVEGMAPLTDSYERTARGDPPDTLIQEGNQLCYNGERVFLVSYSHYGEMCENRLTSYDGQYSGPGAWETGQWKNDPGWHWKAYLDLVSDAGLNFVRTWLYTSRNTMGESYLRGDCGSDLVGLLPWDYDGHEWRILEWDEAYWQRLSEFCGYAWQRGVIVQLCLFARQYTPLARTTSRWLWCPLNPANNADFPWIISNDSYFATAGDIWDGHTQRIIEKTVASVGQYGNILYEIMNEESRPNPLWGSAVAREIERQYRLQGKTGSMIISNNIVYPGVSLTGNHTSRPVPGKMPGIASDDGVFQTGYTLGVLKKRIESAYANWDRGNIGYEHKTSDFLTQGSDISCDNHYEIRRMNADVVNLLAQYALGVDRPQPGPSSPESLPH